MCVAVADRREWIVSLVLFLPSRKARWHPGRCDGREVVAVRNPTIPRFGFLRRQRAGSKMNMACIVVAVEERRARPARGAEG